LLEADAGVLANEERDQGQRSGAVKRSDKLLTWSERRWWIGRCNIWLGPVFAGEEFLHGIDDGGDGGGRRERLEPFQLTARVSQRQPEGEGSAIDPITP
jgi:hypothetical protein